ncbi:uncharacterized protein BDV17DRAFT_165593 [Aspergillus undulatus]|uniref:uncharacterized protein n=1 Tax=Aspergillus undulatus TaxID=1810928 RepID=UPI003CCC93BA
MRAAASHRQSARYSRCALFTDPGQRVRVRRWELAGVVADSLKNSRMKKQHRHAELRRSPARARLLRRQNKQISVSQESRRLQDRATAPPSRRELAAHPRLQIVPPRDEPPTSNDLLSAQPSMRCQSASHCDSSSDSSPALTEATKGKKSFVLQFRPSSPSSSWSFRDCFMLAFSALFAALGPALAKRLPGHLRCLLPVSPSSFMRPSIGDSLACCENTNDGFEFKSSWTICSES